MKYWLTIHPYTYFYITSNGILFYNSLTQKIVANRNEQFVDFFKDLKSAESNNIFEVEFSTENMISEFLNILRDDFFIDLLPITEENISPLQMLRKTKVQNEINESYLGEVGEDIYDNIYKLHIHYNGYSTIEDSYCDAFKQFPFVTKHKSVLDIKALLRQLSSHTLNNLNEVNLIGIIDNNTVQLIEYFIAKEIEINLIYDYNNCDNEINYNKLKANHIISIHNYSDRYNHKKLLQPKNAEIRFIISSSEQLEKANAIIKQFDLNNYLFQPFLTKSNINFFRKHVCLNENEILELNPTINEIITKERLNPNLFGNLYILPDGQTYSNPNDVPLGSIYEDDLSILLLKEFRQNKNWQKVRINQQSCKNCLYQAICPPITNYEMTGHIDTICNIN